MKPLFRLFGFGARRAVDEDGNAQGATFYELMKRSQRTAPPAPSAPPPPVGRGFAPVVDRVSGIVTNQTVHVTGQTTEVPEVDEESVARAA